MPVAPMRVTASAGARIGMPWKLPIGQRSRLSPEAMTSAWLARAAEKLRQLHFARAKLELPSFGAIDQPPRQPGADHARDEQIRVENEAH